MTDAKNPSYIFCMTYTSLLVDAINGAIDLERLAATELANRGLDQGGNWVGFDKAKEILHKTFPQ